MATNNRDNCLQQRSAAESSGFPNIIAKSVNAEKLMLRDSDAGVQCIVVVLSDITSQRSS